MTEQSPSDLPIKGRLNQLRSIAWSMLLLLVWASWWGGLNFYAIVVVPIGTDVIGSVGQGFITQRVTQFHNGLAVIFVVCLIIEAIRTRSKVLGLAAGVLVVTVAALVGWHLHLTSLMDFRDQTVPKRFYAEHAIYLWMTAVEWFVGMIVPIRLFRLAGNEGTVRCRQLPRHITSTGPADRRST